MVAFDGQSRVTSADDSLIDSLIGSCVVGHSCSIISIGGKGIVDIITAEDGAVVDYAAVEGESGIFVTGKDRICVVAVGIDGESAVDGKSCCEVVISGNGQITVFTTVDISCGGIFDTSAVDSGSIVFSIGRTVEFHGRCISNCLMAADFGIAGNAEALGKCMIAANLQIGVTSADDSLIGSLIGS